MRSRLAFAGVAVKVCTGHSQLLLPRSLCQDSVTFSGCSLHDAAKHLELLVGFCRHTFFVKDVKETHFRNMGKENTDPLSMAIGHHGHMLANAMHCKVFVVLLQQF